MGASRGGAAGLAHSRGRAELPVWGSLPAEPAAGTTCTPLGRGSGVPCSRGAAQAVASSQNSGLAKRKSRATAHLGQYPGSSCGPQQMFTRHGVRAQQDFLRIVPELPPVLQP